MERLRQRVRAARYCWQHRRMRKIRLERQVLAFIDETAVTIMMPRLRGSSLRACEELGSELIMLRGLAEPAPGLRSFNFRAPLILYCRVSRRRADCAPGVPEKLVLRAAFDIYISIQLAPLLLPGDVIIADNLPSNKSACGQPLLKAQRNSALFLPSFAPIEMDCPKLKAHLRRFKAGTFDALLHSGTKTCDLFPREDGKTSSGLLDMSQLKWTTPLTAFTVYGCSIGRRSTPTERTWLKRATEATRKWDRSSNCKNVPEFLERRSK